MKGLWAVDCPPIPGANVDFVHGQIIKCHFQKGRKKKKIEIKANNITVEISIYSCSYKEDKEN